MYICRTLYWTLLLGGLEYDENECVKQYGYVTYVGWMPHNICGAATGRV